MIRSVWELKPLMAVMILFFGATHCAEQVTDNPFEVSLVQAVTNDDGTVTIGFETSVPALGTVEITSDNVNYSYVYKAGERYTMVHEITVFDLAPHTAYKFRARAKNAMGQTGYSHLATVHVGAVTYAPKVFQLHMINIPDPGDCFYIVFPNGRKMLYDAGNSTANNAIVGYLQAEGCDTIHYAVATHAHGDHYGSYRWGTVPQVFPIVNFLKPDSYSESTYNSVFSVIQSSSPNVAMHELVRGNSNVSTPLLNIDPDIKITVMSAGAWDLEIDEGNSGGSPNSNFNNESLAMKFTYGNARFLMPGDLEQEAYREYIQNNAATDPEVDVMKASHHLRVDGMNREILAATNPIVVLASTNSEGGCSGIMQCPAMDEVLGYNADLFRIDAVNPNLNRIQKSAASDPGNVVVITDGRSIIIRKK